MAVFRRRGAPGRTAAPPRGMRAASFHAPVPLLSTGVAAVDDIVCGGGVFAGSLLLFVPCVGTATASPAQLGAASLSGDYSALSHSAAASAAEAYTDLLLAYGTAQGIVSKHTVLVISDAPASFVSSLMGYVGDEDVASGGGDTEEPGAHGAGRGDPDSLTAETERMKIAWRYDVKPQLRAPRTEHSSEDEFCGVFDLTRRLSSARVDAARADGTLLLENIEKDGRDTALERAWGAIHCAAEQCRAAAADGASPVLRIVLQSYASPSWLSGGATPASLARFLVRVRGLARSLSMPSDSRRPVPCLVSGSLSPYAAAAQGAEGVNLVNRIVRLSDGCIGLSSFAASPALRRALSEYTGAVRVFRTPTIGTLANPSLRASVLRGMGSGRAPPGAKGNADGGGGGGENNLVFKVRRKRINIETLHLDTDGGVSERRTKPREGPGETRDAPPGTEDPLPGPPHAARTPRAVDAGPVRSEDAAPQPAPPAGFGGLRGLRARGLRSLGRGAAEGADVDRVSHSDPPQTLEF
ncbi:Elongator subunit elp4 [Malassezia sp. CBS 17886]|nr:Elongator subunit elp4 [Malassezia sp. CBS 17886]